MSDPFTPSSLNSKLQASSDSELFISARWKLKSTNQILSILLDTRDQRKKDEASRVIESLPLFSLFFFSFFKRGVYPQLVRLTGSLSFARCLETPSVYRTAIRLATLCIGESRSNAFPRIFPASRLCICARSFAIIGRLRVDFFHRSLLIHLDDRTCLSSCRETLPAP